MKLINEENIEPQSSHNASDSVDDVYEAYNTAPLMNVRNQLMNAVGDVFEFIGGSMNPKFTMTYKEDPTISFDVSLSGNNIEMLPKHDDIPDYTNKIKGISIMRASQVILDFIKKFINEGVCYNMKLMIKESNMNENINDLNEYAKLNIKRFNKIGLKYGCQLYGDVYASRDGGVRVDGYDKTRSDVDGFIRALNRIMLKDGYYADLLKTKPDDFSLLIYEK